MLAWILVVVSAPCAGAQPLVAAALDATEERLVLHEPDGALPVFRTSDGVRLFVLDGPRVIERLEWRGETLVGVGPEGTFVWETRTGRLLHGYATTGPFALSDDGRYVATGHLLVEVGDPVPVRTWPEAEAVAFSDDGVSVATMHDGAAVLHELPRPEAAPKKRRR